VREALVLAQQPRPDQRRAVLIQGGVLFDAHVVVAEVAGREAQLSGCLDQFKEQFRDTHGITVLLAVVGH